jgi:hypothetical protein
MSHPLEAPGPLRFWHLSSLDAPTVAVVWSLSFAKAAEVRLPLWVPCLLVLVTWCVYIGDRLLDARSAMRLEETRYLRERHHFHWHHRRVFLALATAGVGIAAWIIFHLMPSGARERNSLLALAGAVYFSSVHGRPKGRSIPSKELLVGLLFTVGCALPVLDRGAGISVVFLAALLFFTVLAWLNCHAIERWESGGTDCSSASIQVIAVLLAVGGVAGATILCAAHPHEAALLGAGAASATLLALLDRFRRRLSPLALRSAADLVLLTPIVLLG